MSKKTAKIIFVVLLIFFAVGGKDNIVREIPKADPDRSLRPSALREERYRELGKLSRLLSGLSPLATFDNEALVARAENLCAADNFGLSAINEAIGNPEIAIEICLADNEYFCAYEVAKRYQGDLPADERYDPVWLLKQFRDATDNTMSWYTAAQEFEELGLPDEAEEIYEKISPDLGADVLLEFYAREGRDEDAINFINEQGVSISSVVHIGKLHEWGLYDKYLSACQEKPNYRCLWYLESIDITAELLQKYWEELEWWDKLRKQAEISDVDRHSFGIYDKLLVANLAERVGIKTNYYELLTAEILEYLRFNNYFGGWQIENRALYKQILSLAEEEGASPVDLARFAEVNEDYDKAYEWYRQSDSSWIFEGAASAMANGDVEEAEELYSFYLQKMESEPATLNDLTRIAYAQNMTHNWDEAMRTCEQVVSDWSRCECAAEVIEHLYFHINGGVLSEWQLYYDE